MKIAETKLWMVTPAGTKKRLTVTLGKPCRKMGHAACPVAIRGLYEKISDICGEDTWQALILAIKFVRLTLYLWAKKGYKFTFEDGSKLDPEVVWFSDLNKSRALKDVRAFKKR